MVIGRRRCLAVLQHMQQQCTSPVRLPCETCHMCSLVGTGTQQRVACLRDRLQTSAVKRVLRTREFAIQVEHTVLMELHQLRPLHGILLLLQGTPEKHESGHAKTYTPSDYVHRRVPVDRAAQTWHWCSDQVANVVDILQLHMTGSQGPRTRGHLPPTPTAATRHASQLKQYTLPTTQARRMLLEVDQPPHPHPPPLLRTLPRRSATRSTVHGLGQLVAACSSVTPLPRYPTSVACAAACICWPHTHCEEPPPAAACAQSNSSLPYPNVMKSSSYSLYTISPIFAV